MTARHLTDPPGVDGAQRFPYAHQPATPMQDHARHRTGIAMNAGNQCRNEELIMNSKTRIPVALAPSKLKVRVWRCVSDLVVVIGSDKNST